MKTFAYTFGIAETITLPGGAHFEIMSSTDPLDISYFVDQTKIDETALGVSSGYFFSMPRDYKLTTNDAGEQILKALQNTFDKVQITSATVQTVLIGITRGDGGARSTATNITGGSLDDISVVAEVSDRIIKMRTSVYHRRSSAGGMFSIVSPAANVAGVVISNIYTKSTNTDYSALYAHTSTPSDLDPAAHLLYLGEINGTYGFQSGHQNTFPLFIPAGYGIYESAASGGSQTGMFVSYEIL